MTKIRELKPDLKKHFGKKIKISKVTDEEDKFLEGRTGELTAPYACYPQGTVGVWLDSGLGLTKANCNLLDDDEIEFIN